MTDFMKALEDAQREPEPADGKHEIPDIFSSIDSQIDAIYSKVADAQAGIPGILATDFSYRCARFVIGRVFQGIENGIAIYEDIDDSKELTAVMNGILSGKYLQLKKETTFLKDGAVVIWIEWAVQAEKQPAPQGVLSMDALLENKAP